MTRAKTHLYSRQIGNFQNPLAFSVSKVYTCSCRFLYYRLLISLQNGIISRFIHHPKIFKEEKHYAVYKRYPYR